MELENAVRLKVKLSEAVRDNNMEKICQYLRALDNLKPPIAIVLAANLPEIVVAVRKNKGIIPTSGANTRCTIGGSTPQ
jgi:hypothetical protein